MSNDLDLDDARRVIASLNGLKLWIEGSPEYPGVLDVLERVLTELNNASNEIMNLRNQNLGEFGTLLKDTVHSAIAVHSEHSSMEIESVIQKLVENLPSDVAKITIRALSASSRSSKNAKSKIVPDVLQSKVSSQAEQIATLQNAASSKDAYIKSLHRYLISSACISVLSLVVLTIALLGGF